MDFTGDFNDLHAPVDLRKVNQYSLFDNNVSSYISNTAILLKRIPKQIKQTINKNKFFNS